jgi:hypothetical protein
VTYASDKALPKVSAQVLERGIELYTAWGKDDQASALRSRLDALRVETAKPGPPP